MTRRDREKMSRTALIRELDKLDVAERRFAETAREEDRERLIHDLYVRQVELEIENRELREAQAGLAEANTRYSELYEFAPVGYCTLERGGRIRELNATAAALLGESKEALVGSALAIAAPLKDTRSVQAHLRRCQAEQGPVTSELILSFPERGTRTLRIISEAIHDQTGGTTAYRTVLVDVSDLKALEEWQRLLSIAGERLTSSVESALAVEEAARIAVPVLADFCMIDVASPTGHVQRKAVLFADPRKQASLAERLMQFSARTGWESPQARVIACGEPVLLSELSAELRGRISRDDGEADVLTAADVRSLMVVPLAARGRRFGALTLACAESNRRYSAIDLQIAQDLSSRIAMALDNARLYEDAQRANAALRLAEAKSSGIVSIAADAIISIDKDQRIALFNDGAERIFGYSKAEAVGAPLEMLIPERFRALHRAHLERFAAGAEGSRRMGDRGAAILGLRKNGEEFPADAAISKLELGGEKILTVALRDVTDAKRFETEQRLLAQLGLVLAGTLDYEETLTRLAQLIVRDLADFCMVDLLEEDGELRRVRIVARDRSKSWICEAMKHNPAPRSRPWLVWSPLETKQPILLERASPELVASWAQDDDQLAALRGMDPRSIIVVPLLARGKVLGILNIVSSTSKRTYGPDDLRLMEEVAYRAALSIENARLYRVAERAIHARDEVLGVVAHDLRNPLGNILMQVSILERPGLSPDRSRKAAETIDRAVNRMNRLIQDLLDITRMDGGPISVELTRVSVEKTLRDFVEAQRPLATSKSLELRLDVAQDLGDVFVDRDRLLQVLENLVGNAVKFTKPGGRVTVGAAQTGEEILFRVEDTGPGVPTHDLPHLFDRFWQPRKAGRLGVGLGLAIVKGIVEAHGGRTWVESKLGEGSTFFFTLRHANPAPMVADAHTRLSRKREVAPSRRPAGVVLVAEDDPDASAALCETLQQAGYGVVAAKNGADALEYLRRGAQPCMVILDLRMPVMDGWAFLAERNRDPKLRSIPVIVVTGERGVEGRVAAARASYLPKTMLATSLLETIEHVGH